MRHAAFALALVLSVALTLALATDGGLEPPALAIVHHGGEQVTRGAHLYDLNCAACHGDTGLGFEEARAVFPESHQYCERCHRPGNPAKKADMIINMRNSFSLGAPPALHGEGALAGFPTAQALYAYIQATMPRWDPGRLTSAEYLDLTAFLLDVNGMLPAGVTLREDNAASVALDHSP